MEKINENTITAGADGENAKTVSKRAMERFLAAAEKTHKKQKGFSRPVDIGFILMLLAVIVAAVALRQFIIEPTLVDGTSMENYLLDGERVAVNKTAYWFHEPERGDIIICHYPGRTERFVKRIIAFGGETITIDSGYVYINGEQLDETAYAGDWYGHITRLIATSGSRNGVYEVPEGYVFVMGDNRNVSHDSRSKDVGPIACEQVLGKAIAVVWPFSAIRSIG
ncbi:MAG: signal peptidase I [Clostridia bacterium]|nr:signal peptidase I [Clostridia bacterium]MBQ2191379.1 signal peptidase I [Clostridia bacterium]